MKVISVVFILACAGFARANDVLYTCTGPGLSSPLRISGYINADENLLRMSESGKTAQLEYDEYIEGPAGGSHYFCTNGLVQGQEKYMVIQIRGMMEMPAGTEEDAELNIFTKEPSDKHCTKALSRSTPGYDRQTTMVKCVRGESKPSFDYPTDIKGQTNKTLETTFPLVKGEKVLDLVVQNSKPQVLTVVESDAKADFRFKDKLVTLSLDPAKKYTFAGKIRDPKGGYLIGYNSDASIIPRHTLLLRLTPEFDRDPTFGKNGELLLQLGKFGSQMGHFPLVSTAGIIYVPGYSIYKEQNNYYKQPSITKLSSSGVIDQSFQKNFLASLADKWRFAPFVNAVAEDKDGNILGYTGAHPYHGMAHTFFTVVKFSPLGVHDVAYGGVDDPTFPTGIAITFIGYCQGEPNLALYPYKEAFMVPNRCSGYRDNISLEAVNTSGKFTDFSNISYSYATLSYPTHHQELVVDRGFVYMGSLFYGSVLHSQLSVVKLNADTHQYVEDWGVHGRARLDGDHKGLSESPRVVSAGDYIAYGTLHDLGEEKFVYRVQFLEK